MLGEDLYDCAFLLASCSSEEGCAGGVFKDFPYAIVHFGGTFEVLYCADFTGDGFSLPREHASTPKRHEVQGRSSPMHAKQQEFGNWGSGGGGKRGGWGLGAGGLVTSSGLTGRCCVLRSSSIVLGSYRKSFLHPTKMMGRP